MIKVDRRNLPLYSLFTAVVLMNVALWTYSHDLRAIWGNTPPVLSERGATMGALGDPQFAYRSAGIMLQNLGNTGGFSRSMKDYNYERLGQWFLLANKLDPVSNFMPTLVAYYFSATSKAEDLTPVIDYLAMVGQQPGKNKWFWLAQAAYLARYKQNDFTKALDLANKLVAMDVPGMPLWAKQMPAFIMNAKGDREAAYVMMVSVLKANADKMNPADVVSMRDYICKRILTPDQAGKDRLCDGMR